MTILLAILIAVSPVSAPAFDDSVPRDPEACHHVTFRQVPGHIHVFRSHKRGSPIKAKVERWPFREYVAAVMESGAWPSRPRQSARVGAQAIKQYAWWQMVHTCRLWKGTGYAITDSEQYLRRDIHPATFEPRARTKSAISSIWPYALKKNGRFFRPGWRAGSGRDGWHLYEDSITARARWGWGFSRLIHWALDPVRIVDRG